MFFFNCGQRLYISYANNSEIYRLYIKYYFGLPFQNVTESYKESKRLYSFLKVLIPDTQFLMIFKS